MNSVTLVVCLGLLLDIDDSLTGELPLEELRVLRSRGDCWLVGSGSVGSCGGIMAGRAAGALFIRPPG